MIRKFAPTLAFALLAACANPPKSASSAPAAPVTVKIIGFNDFHGNLEMPRQSVDGPSANPDDHIRVPVGGAAYFASAIDRYRAKNPRTLVLSAGDMISGSPITSSLFLDEPTIEVMNRIGVDYNAVGNHEFDRGRQELLRMQNGGCAKFTSREPCQIDKPFRGAQFPFLAANVITEKGKPLFPGTAIRKFGKGREAVTIGIIGLPLKDVATLVNPSGIKDLTFKDEAETINGLVTTLKRQGADAIIVLIHQGLYTKVGGNDKSCGGVSGDLLKVLAKL
ncbi:MAG TPA: metallophosphoesterase, partial [Sphingobium sp.]